MTLPKIPLETNMKTAHELSSSTPTALAEVCSLENDAYWLNFSICGVSHTLDDMGFSKMNTELMAQLHTFSGLGKYIVTVSKFVAINLRKLA